MKPFLAIIGVCMIAMQSFAAAPVAEPKVLEAGSGQHFPYTMVGQLVFTSGERDYLGSGTLIHTRSVLTAGHNIWDETGGWSTDVEFNRGRSGNEMLSQDFATRLYVFGGYRDAVLKYAANSSQAFSRDLGGLRFASAVAHGAYVGWSAYPKLLTSSTESVALGYGAKVHSGDDLLFVQPSLNYQTVSGAYLENRSLIFESGMSGGPVFVELKPGDWRVGGVIVAGSEEPPAGGVRALSADVIDFITKYLRF